MTQPMKRVLTAVMMFLVVALLLVASADPALHVEYRAHSQNIGWGPWVADGAVAGTTGRSLRMEALQVRLVYRA